MAKESFKLYVRCFTFNHARYIKDTMDGFCMQQTNFPYVCIIVDDASSDGEQDLILSYLEQHFVLNDDKIVRKMETEDYVMTFVQHRENQNCFFAVYLLKYNHYSIHKSKKQYITEFTERATYCALCEGDDYWIDPLKLQNQFDYMEEHANCVMTCSRAKRYSVSKAKYVGEQFCRKSDGELSSVDIINRTGLFIPTCSIVFRPIIRNNYPAYCQNCRVGDYPLQITAAMKGSVYYFDRCMSVYRVENRSSWMGRQKHESIDPARLKVVRGQTEMFKGFAKDYPNFRHVFQDKISEHILRNMPNALGSNYIDQQIYYKLFLEELSNLKLKWKIFFFICKLKIPYCKKVFHSIFLRKYQARVFFYGNMKERILFFFKLKH